MPLLQSGLQVDGIDSSDEMLTYCRHNCAAAGLAPTLHRGDLQTMELPDRYSAIVITFGSFMLLASPDEATAALHHIRRHLVPGGRLFVDVDAPRTHTERGESRRVADCRDGCTIVLVDAPVPTDAGDAVVRRSLSYEKWSDGRLIASEAQALDLRRYDEHEMTAVLAGAGFVDIGACADYVEDRPTANADQWLCFSAAIPAP